MKQKRASDWIKEHEMISHPEGGYFKETYRAQGKVRMKSFFSVLKTLFRQLFLLRPGLLLSFHQVQNTRLSAVQLLRVLILSL